MAILSRIIQKVFGETGGTSEFGQFGSNAASPPGTTTKDLTVIQSLSEYLEGWYSATANASEPPRIQDRNALDLLITSQLKYLFQNGVPEWLNDVDQRYYTGVSFVNRSGVIYIAIQGDDGSNINTGKDPLTEPTWWTPVLKALEDDIALNTAASSLNTTHRSSDGNDHFNVANALKGMNHIVLTEYITTTVPAIEINSQAEINGAVYTNPLEIVISGATSNSTWYDILLTPSGTTFTASFVARGTGAWSDSKQGLYSGNNRVVATVYKDASGNFINKNILIINNRLIKIKIEIGIWDMVATGSISIDPELTDSMKIRNIMVVIRTDVLTAGRILTESLEFSDSSYVPNGRVRQISDNLATDIILDRRTGGDFDSTNYNDTSFNRGWVTIAYEV